MAQQEVEQQPTYGMDNPAGPLADVPGVESEGGFKWSNPFTNGSPFARGVQAVGNGLSSLSPAVGAPVGGSAPASTPEANQSVQPPPPAAGPQMSVAPPPVTLGQTSTPPPQPKTPEQVNPQQHAQLMAVGAKAGAVPLTADGLINTEVVKNDIAQLALDDQAKARAMKAVYDANDHVKVMSAIGAQQARDASGADYWDKASTGEKIGRVLLGIVTLGGSESYISAQIRRKVAQDQQDMQGEDNTYKQMIDAGKTAEQAASIDYAKQNHIYALGLDRIAAQHPSEAIQQRVAGLKAGMQKDTSTALLGYYDAQQKNRIAQQGQNTSAYNAQTERMKAGAEIGKMNKPDLSRLVRDTNGNPVGYTDTPDQAKQVQAQQLAVDSLGAMSKKINNFSWSDKVWPEARADAEATYSQTMQLINTYRAAHPNEESSRQMEVLQRGIPDPNKWSTSPAAYKKAFNEQLGLMRMALVKSKKQSGL